MCRKANCTSFIGASREAGPRNWLEAPNCRFSFALDYVEVLRVCGIGHGPVHICPNFCAKSIIRTNDERETSKVLLISIACDLMYSNHMIQPYARSFAIEIRSVLEAWSKEEGMPTAALNRHMRDHLLVSDTNLMKYAFYYTI